MINESNVNLKAGVRPDANLKAGVRPDANLKAGVRPDAQAAVDSIDRVIADKKAA